MVTYTTAQKVADYLQTTISTTSTPTTSTVESWITEYEDKINNEAGCSFTTSAVSDLYIATDVERDVWFPKPYAPLVSITSLYLNSGTDFSPTWTEKVEGTDFLIIDLETSKIKFSPSTSVKALDRGVKVSFVYGYSSVPGEVTDLATKMVAKKYLQSIASTVNISTNEHIKVGPIDISNDTSGLINFMRQLDSDIETGLKGLKPLKSYIY